MLHIHFGAGRLGLGLVVPYFKKNGSKTFIFNREGSSDKPSDGDKISPKVRNALLGKPKRAYLIQAPGDPRAIVEPVRFDGFVVYSEKTLKRHIETVVDHNRSHADLVVTAATVSVDSYYSVINALNYLCDLKDRGEIAGNVYFISCENDFDTNKILSTLAERLSPQAREHLKTTRAIVDRICVTLDQLTLANPQHATVLVRAERYGSLKLEITDATIDLKNILAGTKVEFTSQFEADKNIKIWLLNGAHTLIALQAYSRDFLLLNRFIRASDQNERFAINVLDELRVGASLFMRQNPAFQVVVASPLFEEALHEFARIAMSRFSETEDYVSRILSRFRAPTPDEMNYQRIQNFYKRMMARVSAPLEAHFAAIGAPQASSESLFSLSKLVADGSFIDVHAHRGR